MTLRVLFFRNRIDICLGGLKHPFMVEMILIKIKYAVTVTATLILHFVGSEFGNFYLQQRWRYLYESANYATARASINVFIIYITVCSKKES